MSDNILTEAQQQAQAALDKVMNCRFSNFDAGAVIHWAERGMYEVKVAAKPAPVEHSMWSAMLDVAAERRRQVEVEGWTPAHDDQHMDGSMAQAAAAYALKARSDESHANGVRIRPPYLWPDSWHVSWWKPKDRRRNLVRAAALIIAEIERLDRATLASAEGK